MAVNVEEAINYVIETVDNPALNNPILPIEIKNKIQASATRVKTFRKIGDLHLYLSRFKLNSTSMNFEVFNVLKALGLKTYEDLLPEFELKFRTGLNDVTTLGDFKIGNYYSTSDLTNFSRQYFNNVPGITLINNDADGNVIFVKATIAGGEYPNAWIVPERELKYFFFARKIKGKKVFDEEYKENQIILNSGTTPIYVFIKVDSNFFLNGIFSLRSYHTDKDGSKWFHLVKNNESAFTSDSLLNIERNFVEKIEIAKARSSSERRLRISEADKLPKKVIATVEVFIRNADIVAETLERAGGVCEICIKPAPFLRSKDHTPYLEVHHKIKLADGGLDTLENTIAACPNCHRKLHFG